MGLTPRPAPVLPLLTALLAAWSAGCANPANSDWRAYEGGDYTGALREWRGLAEAQCQRGTMRELGRGAVVDRVSAYARYRLGESRGESAAGERRAALAESLAPDEIARGAALAREFVQRYGSATVPGGRSLVRLGR